MAYASKTYLCFIKSWRVQLAMFTVGESPPISQVNGKKKQKLKLKQKQTNKKANKHTKKKTANSTMVDSTSGWKFSQEKYQITDKVSVCDSEP